MMNISTPVSEFRENPLPSPESLGAQWIWSDGPESANSFVEFRHEFELLEACEDAAISISVDSNYTLWINGNFVDFGQYHDFPKSRTHDTIQLGGMLKEGLNVLCVLAYYQGEGSFQYAKGSPGLIYALKAGDMTIASGADCVCRPSPAYRSGPTARITMQLGFTFEYDARGEDDWTSPSYVPDDRWHNAVVTGPMEATRPRPIRKLIIGEPLDAKVAACGIFKRRFHEAKSIAQMMQADYLSPVEFSELFVSKPSPYLPSAGGLRVNTDHLSSGDGIYLVIDLGREEAGLLELDLESQAGTVIDIAWGEHLEDLRVRAHVGGRNFAGRYICSEGRQRFIHYFTRLAGRYIQLHISGAGEGFVIHYAGLIPVEYPLEVKGAYKSPDGLQNAIYQTSVRTLHLCMHEHYEDCPWREQALYAMDSRNQALSGYYCFGDYDFPAASFDLLGRGMKEDGYLELCAPAEISITIPSFSMAWVMALADYLLYSGDHDFIEKVFPIVRRMMELREKDLRSDLLPCPQGERYWHFYEWADGLDGTRYGDCMEFDSVHGARYDAALNLFYCLALESAAKLAGAVNEPALATRYTQDSGQLRRAIHDTFWDREEGCYVSSAGDGSRKHYAELVQALAILAGTCSAETASDLCRKLVSSQNGLVETTLSSSFYKFEALMQNSVTHATWVFEKISRDWGYMLSQGATSFWETIKGAADFDNAGSLCHGWSGIPVYFNHAYLLGVKPLEPGFRSFSFDPVPGVVKGVSGAVPTPHGVIKVKWESVNGEVIHDVSSPQGCVRKNDRRTE